MTTVSGLVVAAAAAAVVERAVAAVVAAFVSVASSSAVVVAVLKTAGVEPGSYLLKVALAFDLVLDLVPKWDAVAVVVAAVAGLDWLCASLQRKWKLNCSWFEWV